MSNVMKKPVSAQIMEIYQANKQKLSLELAKPHKDKEVLNSIEAYKHIVTSMERTYSLVPGGERD